MNDVLTSPCERYPAGTSLRRHNLGNYCAVVDAQVLPPSCYRDDRVVEHGYAVGTDRWTFFIHLPPALVFGRAARMSADCRSYGVYRAAREIAHCRRHGSEPVLHVDHATSLDRCADEALYLNRWLQGVRPGSAYWYPPVDEDAKRCAVYLHYDTDGVLLYVGITDDILKRGKAHSSKSVWTRFAVRGEHVWCADRSAALAKEMELITTLKPIFNDKHADPGRPDRVAAYLAGRGRLDLLTNA